MNEVTKLRALVTAYREALQEIEQTLTKAEEEPGFGNGVSHIALVTERALALQLVPCEEPVNDVKISNAFHRFVLGFDAETVKLEERARTVRDNEETVEVNQERAIGQLAALAELRTKMQRYFTFEPTDYEFQNLSDLLQQLAQAKMQLQACERLGRADLDELRKSSAERQAALEILGRAIGELLPDFRASGTVVEHAAHMRLAVTVRLAQIRALAGAARDLLNELELRDGPAYGNRERLDRVLRTVGFYPEAPVPAEHGACDRGAGGCAVCDDEASKDPTATG